MSFINELKRRNVFRVGIAYAVAAWLIAQVTELAADSFGAPEWVMQMLLIVLALGLPVSLLLAWALELTPEGIRKEKDVDRSQSIAPQTGKKLNNTILLLMALAIAYLLLDKLSGAKVAGPGSQVSQVVEPSTGTEDSPSANLTVVSRQSIAVLPFDNRSNLEEDEFFVEGMHDDLLTNLAKIGSLKVISRTSVARYKDTETPIPEIARELGVATIMEGAVQRAGGTVRINVQLIDAQTDEHLWADTFDRELTTENLFAIQTEISKEIAAQLKATLSADEQERVNERPTDNLAAYNAYLRGRQLIARRTAETVDQALLEFQRAVQMDPQFALAWVGIAEAAHLALWVSDMDRPESVQLSREAIEKAMAVNDRLGEVHLARAELNQMTRGDDQEREEAYKLALELSPGYAQAWQKYAGFLSGIPGRLDEAFELAEKAAELDPLSTAIQNQLIAVLRRQGKNEEAEQRLLRLIEQDPEFAGSYEQMARLKSEVGRFDEAIFWLHKAQSLDPGNIGFVLREMWPQMAIGNTDELDPLIERMSVMDPDSSTLSFMEIFINLYKKNFDAAMEAARLFDQKTGYRPGGKFPQWQVHSLRGDNVSAREIIEEILPDFNNRETFQQALDSRPWVACDVAWSMAHTGDEEMGADLARQTLDYFQDTLSAEAERFSIALCYMVLDKPEQALLVIEGVVESGNVSRWWRDLKHPAYNMLQHDSRFIAAEEAIQSIIAGQRENLHRLNTEGE